MNRERKEYYERKAREAQQAEQQMLQAKEQEKIEQMRTTFTNMTFDFKGNPIEIKQVNTLNLKPLPLASTPLDYDVGNSMLKKEGSELGSIRQPKRGSQSSVGSTKNRNMQETHYSFKSALAQAKEMTEKIIQSTKRPDVKSVLEKL